MALAPLAQTLLITASRTKVALSQAVTVPGAPTQAAPPSFLGAPSVTTDGTPQVGEQLIGVDAGVANLGSNTLSRRWLFGSSPLAATAAFTPTQVGAHTFQNRITAPDGTTVLASASVDVTVAAGAATPTPPPPPPPVDGSALAIVLQNLSEGWVTGQNPPDWDSSFSGIYYDAESGTGDKLRMRWKLDDGTWHTEAFVPFDTELVLNGFSYPFLTDGSLFAGGAFTVQEQAVRDQGLVSEVVGDWSNEWTDTLEPGAESASLFASVAGEDRSHYFAASDPSLVVVGQGGFTSSPLSVRALNARTGKRQFQVTVHYVTGYAGVHLGVDDGTTNFDQGFPRPGQTNSAGVTLGLNPYHWGIHVGGAEVQSGDAGSYLADGDILTCTFDTDAGTVSFYKTRYNSVTGKFATVQYGVPQAVALSEWVANVALEGEDTFTAKFDAGQARPLDAGYFPYDK